MDIWLLISFIFVIYHIVRKVDARMELYALMLILIMLISQTILIYFFSYFSENYKYRWMNEGVFLLPAIFLFLD